MIPRVRAARLFRWVPLAAGLAGAASCVVFLASLSYFDVYDLLTTDNDSQMRMAFLTWAIHGGSLHGVAFPRDGLGDGIDLHWTLPYNLVSLGLAAPMAAVAGWHDALRYSPLVTGPLPLVLLLGAIARLANVIHGRDAIPWTLAWLPALPRLANYTRPGMMNHHEFVVIIGVMGFASAVMMLKRPSPRRSLETAVWLTLGMWESIEAVSYTAAISVIIASGVAMRGWNRHFIVFCIGLPLLTTAALLADPPSTGIMDALPDRFSIVHVGMAMAIGSLAYWSSRFASSRPLIVRAVMGGFPMLVVMLAFGTCIEIAVDTAADGGLFKPYYLDRVSEMRPLLRLQGTSWQIIAPALAVFVAMIMAAMATCERRIAWAAGAAVMGQTLAIGLIHNRFMPHSEALATAILASGSAALWGWAGIRTRAMISVASFVPAAWSIVIAADTHAWSNRIQANGSGHPGCVVGDAIGRTVDADLPPSSRVAADIWFAPELLVRTNQSIVAGPYHRDAQGIEAMGRLLSATSTDAALSIVEALDAQAIMICRDTSVLTSPIYGNASMMARMVTARGLPDWIVPIQIDPTGKFQMELVVPWLHLPQAQ